MQSDGLKKCNVGGSSLEIVKLLGNNQEGTLIKDILLKLGLKARNTYKHLNNLKKLGLILHIFPLWKLSDEGYNFVQGRLVQSATFLGSDKNSIQLHDISFVIRLIRFPDWWVKRNNRLVKLKAYDFRQLRFGNNEYSQLSNGDFIIQTFSNSIIFFNRKHYLGIDSYDCFISSVKDFLDFIEKFERDINFKLFMDNVPCISIRSSHYVKLRDAVAKKCKLEDNHFSVFIDGKLRLWVDFSDPLGMEAGHKNFGVEDINKYSIVVSDYVKNNVRLPSVVDNDVIELKYIIPEIKEYLKLEIYNKQLHQKVLEDMQLTLKEIRDSLKK